MPQPIWRELVRVTVPERRGAETRQWTMALEQVTAGKLIKLEVVVDPNVANSGTWQPKDFANRCTADGDFRKIETADTKLLPTAPGGALIARIGGSTTDQPVIADPAAPPASLLAVGRKCVFTVPANTNGPLYFAPNVPLTVMSEVIGELVVSVSEAL